MNRKKLLIFFVIFKETSITYIIIIYEGRNFNSIIKLMNVISKRLRSDPWVPNYTFVTALNTLFIFHVSSIT